MSLDVPVHDLGTRHCKTSTVSPQLWPPPLFAGGCCVLSSQTDVHSWFWVFKKYTEQEEGEQHFMPVQLHTYNAVLLFWLGLMEFVEMTTVKSRITGEKKTIKRGFHIYSCILCIDSCSKTSNIIIDSSLKLWV